jgi:hypothetical protein
MMESNPVLADGGQWFDSSNTYTGANPLSCLENGFEKFAGQQFPNGDYVGAVPTLLVVPPSWTLTVDDFTSDIVLQRPYLIKTPWVTNGYLIAGANCPSVALIGLDQTLLPQIETNPAPPKDFDIGLQAKVTHTFAVLPLQRAGIVRLAITP